VVAVSLKKKTLAITLHDLRNRGSGRVWRLTGASLEAANKVGQPPAVTIQESRLPALSHELTQPPISVSIYEFAAVESTTR